MSEILVVKIGGEVLDKPDNLQPFLQSFARLPAPKILVHGGGILASRMARQLGITPRMVNGRRITDAAMLEVAIMVYAGLLNKRIVAGLQRLECPAIGLTGADAGSIRAVRRPPQPIDFGYVGDVEKVNVSILRLLLDAELVPVFAPLTYSQEGDVLNTNADTIATALARALSKSFPTRLFFCLDVPGVLHDPENQQTLIPRLSRSRYQHLKENGLIRGGMIPKLDNGFAALAGGVKQVVLCHFRQLETVTAPKTVRGTELIHDRDESNKGVPNHE